MVNPNTAYTISKELFEAVMENNWLVLTHHNIEINHNRIIYKYQDPNAFEPCEHCELEDFITINDFFFKCIDFALENEFILVPQFEPTQTVIEVFKDGKRVMFRGHVNRQQAMFNTCQWILENKGKL